MKTKDTYWFRHDSNAKDDFKIMLLIEQLGLEGYGIFWVIIETLREQKDYRYPFILLSALSRKYNTTETKMQTVVKSYELFEIDNESFFFSKSLNLRMENLDKIKEQRKLAGRKSGEARRKKAIEHKLNKCSTDDERFEKNRLEYKEEEKEDIKIYIQNLQNNEFKFEAEIDTFVEYLIHGKAHKIDSRLFYTKRIVDNLISFDNETLLNFQDYLKNKDTFIFQTKGIHHDQH